MKEYLSIKQASLWATAHLQKEVSASNISYLIQYGKVAKHTQNGNVVVDKHDLLAYYKRLGSQRKNSWEQKLGQDLHWALSFEHVKERETTKHVHRLHPYKGKFIPQLAEYFMGAHTDAYKQRAYFQKGDIVLDPFCGSGTTLVQASELGMHAIGVDISAFNALIANVKVAEVDLCDLDVAIKKITSALEACVVKNKNAVFENDLLEALYGFNKKYFPSPEYKVWLRQNAIDEKEYSQEKEARFQELFEGLKRKHGLEIVQNGSDTFLKKWYLAPVRKEIDCMYEEFQNISNPITKNIVMIMISRTIRSCRATTHADLATLKEPVTRPYYCSKHGKICKPLFSALSWWRRYSVDTKSRLLAFKVLKTNTFQICLQGDARTVEIASALSQSHSSLARLVEKQKIKGIFSSPPYVGLIDYHEQHAYAYELFQLSRNDALEIGPLYKGQGQEARATYIEGIARTLTNTKQYLQEDYDVFLVANDKYNMYSTIAEKAGMSIVNKYQRPVLNRTEKDKSAYAETIFHLKET